MTFRLNMVDGISYGKNTPPFGSMIFPALSHHLVWSPFLAFEALDFAEGASLWEVVGRAAGRTHGHVHVQTRYSESHPPVVCTQLHWAQAYMSLAVLEKRDSRQGRCAGIHKCLGCRTGWNGRFLCSQVSIGWNHPISDMALHKASTSFQIFVTWISLGLQKGWFVNPDDFLWRLTFLSFCRDSVRFP